MINIPDEAKLKKNVFLEKNSDIYMDFDIFLKKFLSILAKIRDPARYDNNLVCYKKLNLKHDLLFSLNF